MTTKTSEAFAFPFLVVIFLVWVAAMTGWVLNIISIFGGTFDPLTGVMILRVVGIFVAPLGAIMGWI